MPHKGLFHSAHEVWAAQRTRSFNDGNFESAIVLDSLVKRTEFTAAKHVAHDTFVGGGAILPAATMDSLFTINPANFTASVWASLNLGVNELADVLRTFFANVVVRRTEHRSRRCIARRTYS